jgi:coatomer subunit beta
MPAYCSEIDFRAMWADFEWENKVAVRTPINSLRGYLDHLLSCTNMRCLTPSSALAGECDFLAANLYARSVFGEDALANLSIEKTADGKVRVLFLFLSRVRTCHFE